MDMAQALAWMIFELDKFFCTGKMMKINKPVIEIISVTLMLTILMACGQSEPLQSLTSDALSKPYDFPFWLHEASLHSKLWQQAQEYCAKQVNVKPNCQTIEQVQWMRPLANKVKTKQEGFGPNDL